MDLLFATSNKNKVIEMRTLLGPGVRLLSLEDVGCQEEIPETSDTIEGNALQKVRYIIQKYHIDCFADDTGMEVDVLDGRPGVFSARYAGDSRDANKNMDKVLGELSTQENRGAQFRTILALILGGKEFSFEGIMRGTILYEKRGNSGFGYDPIFQPQGFSRSFAEMNLTEKNGTSHRAAAALKMAEFLNSRLG